MTNSGTIEVAESKVLKVAETITPGVLKMNTGAKVDLATTGQMTNTGINYIGGTVTNTDSSQQTFGLTNDKFTVNATEIVLTGTSSTPDTIVNNALTNVTANALAVHNNVALNNMREDLIVGTS